MPLGALYKTSVTAETPAEQSFRMTNFLSLWTSSFSHLSWILFTDFHSPHYLHWWKLKENQGESEPFFASLRKKLSSSTWLQSWSGWTAQPPPFQSAIPTMRSAWLWTNQSIWPLWKARAFLPLLIPPSFDKQIFDSEAECQFLINTYELWNESCFHLIHFSLMLDLHHSCRLKVWISLCEDSMHRFVVMFLALKGKARIRTVGRVSSPSTDWSSLGSDFFFPWRAFILLQLRKCCSWLSTYYIGMLTSFDFYLLFHLFWSLILTFGCKRDRCNLWSRILCTFVYQLSNYRSLFLV